MATSPVNSSTTLIALGGLKSANADAAKATERLATGLKVVRASDDPAGVGKAAQLKAEVASYMQAKKNINSALGEMQSVTDGINGILDYLAEMRTIAVAASSETNEDVRATMNAQFQELAAGIDEITSTVTFANKNVLGANAGAITVQVGITQTGVKALTFTSATRATLGLTAASANVSAGASVAISSVTQAINTVSQNLAKYGGYEASLQNYSDMADSAVLSKSSQYGDIMNADLAVEATNLASARIRQDAATAVLAQANSMNRNIADYLLNGALG